MPEKSKLARIPKVVHLDPDSNKSTRAKLARLPAAVHAVHEKGKFLISTRLSQFFDQVDDSLFELADKAVSNQDQNIYFDSMREIRVQRRGIEKAFIRAIDDAFVGLISIGQEETADTEQTLTSNTLSLISNDDLEEMVAVDSTVNRASRELAEPIQHISLRLDSLVPAKVYQKNNPLGPQVLCAAFTSQVKGLDVDIKVKLVLFKLFDRSVIGGLSEIYKQINSLLVDHNVLPSLSGGTERPASAARAESPPTGHATTAAGAGMHMPAGSQPSMQSPQPAPNPEVIEALRQLFGDRLVSQASPQEQMLAGNELMALLSMAQKVPGQGFQPGSNASHGATTQSVGHYAQPVTHDIRTVIGEMQKQSGIRAKIDKVDDEVINLVNMLFEFILQDRNLATPMKAVISRMQIPIVKVALVDKTFFTKGGHSARKLLNEMATAALGWQGDQADGKDPLYNKMDSIVSRLLQDFDADVSIFHELLTDFTAFMENERRRSAVMERRTVDAEDGKAKAEIARTTVALEIELRTLDRQVPKVVLKLINDAWSNVLFVLGLKHGFDSREWKSALITMEHLLWSVSVPSSNQQRQKLIKLVPDLLRRLRTGFDTISFNPFEMSSLFKSLEEVHLLCIRGKGLPADEMAPVVSTPVIPPAAPASTEQYTPAEIPEQKAAVEKAAVEEVEKTPPVPESVAVAKAVNDSVEVAQQELGDDDVHMRQVENFVQGAWFELKLEEEGMSRCRLAAYIRPTGKYIFVNRNGMKVAEKNQQELAEALKQGHVRALDNSMLFDRALETVVTSLRKNP